MTWTYNGDPTSSTLAEVRFLVGDTIASDPQFSDEEINYILAGQPSALLAAVLCCDHMIAKYARLCTQSVGAISVQYAERQKNYEGLRKRLVHRAPAVPYAGGISISDKASNQQDEDWDQPAIWRGMDTRRG